MISVYGFADENVGTISTWKLLYREKSNKGVVKNTCQIRSLDLLKWQQYFTFQGYLHIFTLGTAFENQFIYIRCNFGN